MLKFLNFGHRPTSPPLNSSTFRPRFLRPWAKNQNSVPNIFLPHPPVYEKVWHNHLAPKPWVEIDLVEKSLFRVWAWPWGPWDPSHPPKNYLQVVGLTLKIWPQSDHGVIKLFHIVAVTDGQTDRQTHILNPLDPWGNFFYLYYFLHWGYGKLPTLQNFYHFTSWTSLHSWRKRINQMLDSSTDPGWKMPLFE